MLKSGPAHALPPDMLLSLDFTFCLTHTTYELDERANGALQAQRKRDRREREALSPASGCWAAK